MRQALLKLEEMRGEIDVFRERGRERVGAGQGGGVRGGGRVDEAREEGCGGEDLGEVLFSVNMER